MFTDKSTHLLLTAHENYVDVQNEATAPATKRTPLIGEYFVGVRNFDEPAKYSMKDCIVSDSTMIEIRKFCLKADMSIAIAVVVWCTTAEMFSHLHYFRVAHV